MNAGLATWLMALGIVCASGILGAVCYYLFYRVMRAYAIALLFPILFAGYLTFKPGGYNLFVRIEFWILDILMFIWIIMMNITQKKAPKLFVMDIRRGYVISFAMMNFIYILGLLKNLIPGYEDINLNTATGILILIFFLVTFNYSALYDEKIPKE